MWFVSLPSLLHQSEGCSSKDVPCLLLSVDQGKKPLASWSHPGRESQRLQRCPESSSQNNSVPSGNLGRNLGLQDLTAGGIQGDISHGCQVPATPWVTSLQMHQCHNPAPKQLAAAWGGEKGVHRSQT